MMKKLCLGAAVCLGLVAPAAADSGSPALSEVSLFKNGLGYFVHQGNLSAGAGLLTVDGVVPATHGTYWVDYDPRVVSMRSIAARNVRERHFRPAVSIGEIIAANIGAEVELHVGKGYIPRKIVAVLVDTGSVAPMPIRENTRIWPFPVPHTVVLSDGECETYLSIDEIRRIRSDRELNRSLPVDVEKSAIDLDYVANWESPFRLSYLRKGITWVPSYKIDIAEKDSAVLRLQAVVINEADDLERVRVNFVSGFPNLSFSDIPSPLSLDQSLYDFLNALGGGRRAYRRESVLMNQMAMAPSPMDEMGGQTEYATPGGDYVEDLFYYPIENVSLAKGERGYYTILSGRVPYEHIYTWEIPREAPMIRNYGYQGSPREGVADDIWHAIRFRNTFAQPLTTAPAMTVSQDKILGQDILPYTSPGASSRVRISKAADIKPDRQEVEVSRKRDAARFNNDSFDEVTIEGTVSVRNFGRKDVSLEIIKVFEGALASADGAPEETRLPEGIRQLNPTTRLEWLVELPAGGHRQFKYRYTVFVRT